MFLSAGRVVFVLFREINRGAMVCATLLNITGNQWGAIWRLKTTFFFLDFWTFGLLDFGGNPGPVAHFLGSLFFTILSLT